MTVTPSAPGGPTSGTSATALQYTMAAYTYDTLGRLCSPSGLCAGDFALRTAWGSAKPQQAAVSAYSLKVQAS